jgi:hypothetical protein
MCSGVVSTIDFAIVGSDLTIDTSDAVYSFSVLRDSVSPATVSQLQLLGWVTANGFDATWPQPLPSLSAPAGYAVIDNSADSMSPPPDSFRQALNVLHSYYQSHHDELIAQAQARAREAAEAAARINTPPVSFIRLEYPAALPTYK